MYQNDIISAVAFIASKLMGTKGIYRKYKLSKNIYSYDGSSIYDFKRRGFIRITNKSDNELELYDFINKSYISVIRKNDKLISIKEESKPVFHLSI